MSELRVSPGELREVAGRLDGLADRIGQHEGGAREIVDQINWFGTSHESIIRGQLDGIAGVIREAQGQLKQAAAGLRTYAAQIEQAR